MKTCFIAGHGRLPSGMAARSQYETLAITVEIDEQHGVILEADCTLATEQAKRFIRGVLRGYCLEDGIEKLTQELNAVYHGAAKAAIITALKDVEIEYRRHLSLKSPNT